jgi:hypothetical protein
MKLCYRGVVHSYYSSSVQSVETEEAAMFLGKTYKVRQPIYQPKQQTLNLRYRGVAYHTGHPSTAQQPTQHHASEFVTKLSASLGLSSQS